MAAQTYHGSAQTGLDIANFYSSMVNAPSSSHGTESDEEVVFLGTAESSANLIETAVALSESKSFLSAPSSSSLGSQHTNGSVSTSTALTRTFVSSKDNARTGTSQPHYEPSADSSLPLMAPVLPPQSQLQPPSDNRSMPLPAELATLHAAALAEIRRLRRADKEWPVEYLPGACFSVEGCDSTSEEEEEETDMFSSTSSSSKGRTSRSSKTTTSRSTTKHRYWCAACQCHVTNTPPARAAHDASTAHLLKAFELAPQDLSLERHVQLPNHNRGFKLLAKLGFDERDGGLGAQRQGRREPIPTSLKLDRRGLGRAPRPQPQPDHVAQPLAGVNAVLNPSPSSQSSSSSTSSSVVLEKPAPRRVTHFPSHQPHQEYDGGVSTAKEAQDSLSDRRRGNRAGDSRRRDGNEGANRGEGGGGSFSFSSDDIGSGRVHGKKRRRGGLSRQTLDERLAKKREGALRRELSGSVPEGYEEYF